ncbi:unnamed protein product [Rotaria sp. Silwood1]|nr:unnamed protein product [Rotaria sp. Silwood1]
MDLSTKYMGLKLKNPIVPSASPLSKNLDSVKQLEDAGAAAIVCYSLFEEQITHDTLELDYFLTRGINSYPEALTYFPEAEDYNLGPDEYLRHISRMKETGFQHLPSASDPDSDFEKLSEMFITGYLEANPESATSLGLHHVFTNSLANLSGGIFTACFNLPTFM